jgi:hypothetical protein
MNTHSIHKKIVRSETYRLQILIKRWKDLTLKQIDKQAVLTLRDELLALGRSGETINHYFNTLSKLFQMVNNEWDLPITNPIKGIGSTLTVNDLSFSTIILSSVVNVVIMPLVSDR